MDRRWSKIGGNLSAAGISDHPPASSLHIIFIVITRPKQIRNRHFNIRYALEKKLRIIWDFFPTWLANCTHTSHIIKMVISFLFSRVLELPVEGQQLEVDLGGIFQPNTKHFVFERHMITRVISSTFQPPTLQTLKGCRNCMRMLCPVSPCWQPLVSPLIGGRAHKGLIRSQQGDPTFKRQKGRARPSKDKCAQKSPSLPASKEAIVLIPNWIKSI